MFTLFCSQLESRAAAARLDLQIRNDLQKKQLNSKDASHRPVKVVRLELDRNPDGGASLIWIWVTLVCGRYRQFCTIHEINVFAKQNCCKIKCPGSYQQEIAHTVTRRPAEGKKWKKHYSNYCLKGDPFNSQAGASDILVTTLKIFHNFKFCIYSCF